MLIPYWCNQQIFPPINIHYESTTTTIRIARAGSNLVDQQIKYKLDNRLIYIMRLSIRLQQHGKKNHPYWWIVVAPQHKNIFGRNTEHIGFWSPRHNVNIKRQVIINMPKLIYWLGNGAVPTPRVHKFLHMFGLFPKPWHYQKSAKQLADLAAKEKPYEEMTPKQKSLKDRKKKRTERTELNAFNYHRYESKAMFPKHKYIPRILAKHQANQFENLVIREAMQQTDLKKYDKIAQLSGKEQSRPIMEQLNAVREKLRKAKSELALLEKENKSSQFLKKSKVAQMINVLITRLNDLEVEQSILKLPEDVQNTEQFVTEDYLQKKLKYELITKKFEKNLKDMENIGKLFEPITVGELAQKLKQIKQNNPDAIEQSTDQQFYAIARDIVSQRNLQYSPLTRIDLITLDEKQSENYFYSDNLDYHKQGSKFSYKNFLQFVLQDEVVLPSLTPVHPRPDIRTYIPQQHYDPIDHTKLDIMMMDSLEPQQELEKYKKKRNFEQPAEVQKRMNHKKRMERLRLLIQN